MKKFVESPEGQELAALCLDYGYKLAERPSDLTRPQINFLVAALVERLDKVSIAKADKAGVNQIIIVDDEDEGEGEEDE
jgi:hypothetical protein